MAQLPAFSHFTAVSELFVTAAVYYVLWRGYYRNDLRTVLLGVTLTFEATVNMAYMVMRLALPGEHIPRSDGMTWLLAFHGTLSLLMFAALVGFAFEARRFKREGRNVLRERPKATLAFAIFWGISVLSGEAIYLVSLAS